MLVTDVRPGSQKVGNDVGHRGVSFPREALQGRVIVLRQAELGLNGSLTHFATSTMSQDSHDCSVDFI